MIDLILHDATRAQIERFAADPTHAVLLTGPDGTGKTAIAEALAAKTLGLEVSQLSSYPYYLVVRPEGASISIDAIRRLQQFLRLKTVGTAPLRRIVVIEYAHTLTLEAQNAYLKLLEEPPADTLMILTARGTNGLLPTILSRTQTIVVSIPSEAQLQPLFGSSKKTPNQQKQAYFLSGGLPGLLYALLAGDDQHPMLLSVTKAKELLQKQSFERLVMVDELSKQKEMALGVVEALDRIAHAGLLATGTQQDTHKVKQWHVIRKKVTATKQALTQSANTKLALSNLFLNFS